MKDIIVNLKQNSYSISFINGFNELEYLANYFKKYNKILVITDDIVEGLYLKPLLYELSKLDKHSCFYTFKNGEQSKCINTAMDIISFMVNKGFQRSDLIIALGGGVVGDLSGFVSSIYMRGIDFIQIPTTLLASVDASIGGKTAIDIVNGKNLVGTFYQPKIVIEIMSIFKELDERLVKEGLSEIIKYGAISDKNIFSLVDRGVRDNIEEIIYLCANAKAIVVSQDEKESELRKILNYGHTYGHAIEKCSHYLVSHGVAVAHGMLFENYLASKLGYCTNDYYENIKNIIFRHLLIQDIRYPVDDLVEAMKSDKKNNKEAISFVFPDGNKNHIENVDYDVVKEHLIEYMKDYQIV